LTNLLEKDAVEDSCIGCMTHKDKQIDWWSRKMSFDYNSRVNRKWVRLRQHSACQLWMIK